LLFVNAGVALGVSLGAAFLLKPRRLPIGLTLMLSCVGFEEDKWRSFKIPEEDCKLSRRCTSNC
jgi:hypothetical protein